MCAGRSSGILSAMLDPRLIAPETTRPITRREYERMVELGMFEGERVELLHGTIVTMSPHGPDHDESVNTLQERLSRALGDRARVRVQSAFAASDESEPEPDIAVVPRRSYRDGHPASAWLIVEVARTSLAKDREVKARLYAASGVEEYWVVDLVNDVVRVYRDARDDGYATETTRTRGETLRMAAFADVEVRVDDVLGADAE